MSPYSIEFADGWEKCFSKFDASVKQRLMKKILQLQYDLPARHLKKGLPFFVLELGQHRICYALDEKHSLKRLHFVGDHKQYEKWLGI